MLTMFLDVVTTCQKHTEPTREAAALEKTHGEVRKGERAILILGHFLPANEKQQRTNAEVKPAIILRQVVADIFLCEQQRSADLTSEQNKARWEHS